MVEKVRDIVEALNTLRMACFGQTLDPDYKTYISSFADAYVKLGIDVTPKVHAVLVHVPQSLYLNLGHGLGLWSKQALESLHFDFEDLGKFILQEIPNS